MLSDKATYLLDKPDIFPEPVEIQRVDRPPVQLDGPGRGIVPSLKQADDGALAGTALALPRSVRRRPKRS